MVYISPIALFIVEEAEIQDLSGIRKKFTSLSVSPITYTTLYDPTIFRWDFGDGTPIYETIDRVTYHTYITAGIYLVKHQACNFCSCSDWNACPQSINVTSEIIITATSIDINLSRCMQPCTITATVVWQNIGNTQGSFDPAIIITRLSDGTTARINLGSIITLDPDQFTTQIVFTVSSLSKDIYTICPDPN